MQNNIVDFNVLTTLSAAGADISFANNKFSITGGLSFDPRLVQSTSGIITTVAETVQVDTLTPTAANSTAYRVNIIQVKPNGVIANETFNYVSDASATATEICDAFRSMINQNQALSVVASGTTTLIITADAGYPVFTTSVAGSAGTIAIALTTPGVYAVNTYASLVANGVPAADLTVGATYTSWQVNYANIDGSVDKITDNSVNQWTVYVQDGISNQAAFTAKLRLLNGFVTNNPLNLMLSDTGLTDGVVAGDTVTAAELSTGHLVFTGGVGSVTLPTATLLGAQLGASAGTKFDFILQNTAGTGTCTLVVGANMVAVSALTGGTTMTLANSATDGMAWFRITFISSTACIISRMA